MKLEHQTEVAATPEDVWEFLQNTRAVVQCLPGAELVEELDDDQYRGILHVAIGPLKMNYAGDVSVVQRDAGERQMVLDATGRDKRGSGAVQAHVRLRVSPTDHGSRIDVVSDLDLTGRIASLGRGVRDVSNRMFVQFAGQLGDRVEGRDGLARPAEAAQVDAPRAAVSEPVGSYAAPSTDRPAAYDGHRAAPVSAASAGEIKVLPLVWGITRERFADFLDRLSQRVRPR